MPITAWELDNLLELVRGDLRAQGAARRRLAMSRAAAAALENS